MLAKQTTISAEISALIEVRLDPLDILICTWKDALL